MRLKENSGFNWYGRVWWKICQQETYESGGSPLNRGSIVIFLRSFFSRKICLVSKWKGPSQLFQWLDQPSELFGWHQWISSKSRRIERARIEWPIRWKDVDACEFVNGYAITMKNNGVEVIKWNLAKLKAWKNETERLLFEERHWRMDSVSMVTVDYLMNLYWAKREDCEMSAITMVCVGWFNIYVVVLVIVCLDKYYKRHVLVINSGN